MEEGESEVHFPKESVHLIASSAGFDEISDEVAILLVTEMEYSLKEVAQQAMKFMKHAKRSRLTTVDVNHALHAIDVRFLTVVYHIEMEFTEDP